MGKKPFNELYFIVDGDKGKRPINPAPTCQSCTADRPADIGDFTGSDIKPHIVSLSEGARGRS